MSGKLVGDGKVYMFVYRGIDGKHYLINPLNECFNEGLQYQMLSLSHGGSFDTNGMRSKEKKDFNKKLKAERMKMLNLLNLTINDVKYYHLPIGVTVNLYEPEKSPLPVENFEGVVWPDAQITHIKTDEEASKMQEEQFMMIFKGYKGLVTPADLIWR